MAEVASAPVETRPGAGRARLRVSAWTLVVGASVVLLVGGAAVFAAGWLLTGTTRVSSYRVAGQLLGVQVRVLSGDVVVVGGAEGGVDVRRTDRATFGRGPVEWRQRSLGTLAIASACPKLVVGGCSASYRISVPDNVPVSVRADHGSIRVDGYRGSASLATGGGGTISVDAFCGHTLRAVSTAGDLTVVGSCSPDRLELRTAGGDISATVPAGRYRIDASAGKGRPVVRGLTADPASSWEIQALSTSGAVTLAASS